MALSSLQAQLAAIQDGGKNYSSSLRHEEAIGRGSQYNVQTGARRGPSHRFQPSLLYATAAEAADVPLSALQAQCCEQGLPVLAQMEPALQDHVDALVQATAKDESKTTKKAIRSTLFLIASLLSSASHSDTCSEDFASLDLPSRYVLEYLVRKFEIQIHYPVDLFWACYLSSSGLSNNTTDTNIPLLQRCWELIDWGQTVNSASYGACLRQGLGGTPTIRSLVQHIDVVRDILSWTHLVATIATDPASVVAQSAALLIPAIVNCPVHDDARQEALLRAILPVLRFDDMSDDYVQWSFCVASALVEVMDVSQAVREDLCTRILRTSHEHTKTAVTCVLSMLLAPRAIVPDNSTSSHLLIAVGEEHWIGCPSLSEIIYKLLFLEGASFACLQQLHSSSLVLMTPILVTALVHSLSGNDLGRSTQILRMVVTDSQTSDNPHHHQAICNGLFHYLRDDPRVSSELLDILRPHCSDFQVEQQRALQQDPKGLLADEESVILYLQVKDIDWNLLASHIVQNELSRENFRLGTAVVERARGCATVTVDVVQAVAYFAPHHRGAVACMWSWTESSNAVLAEAAVQAIETMDCMGLLEAITIAEKCPECSIAVLKAVNKEWRKESTKKGSKRKDKLLVEKVSELILGVVSKPENQSPQRCKTVRPMIGLVLSRLSSSKQEQQGWLVKLAQRVQSSDAWKNISQRILSVVKAQGIVAACCELVACRHLAVDSSKDFAVERLLGLVVDGRVLVKGPDKKNDNLMLLLIPVLSFLSNGNQGVRSAAAKILVRISNEFVDEETTTSLSLIGEAVTKSLGSAQLGGSAYLSNTLTTALADNQAAKKHFLKLCLDHHNDYSKAGKMSSAVAMILNAIESAGEDIFPLAMRWKMVGHPIVRSMLDCSAPRANDAYVVKPVTRLLAWAPNSTELGEAVKAETMKHYPDSMAKVITDALESTQPNLLVPAVVEGVLTSGAWKQGVFLGLKPLQKIALCEALVGYICREADQDAEDAMMGLPLTSEDVLGLLSDEREVGSLSVIVDFVRENGASMMRDEKSCGTKLCSRLFEIMGALLENGVVSADEMFVIQSLLIGVRRLLQVDNQMGVEAKLLGLWLETLTSILRSSCISPFVKLLSVSVMASLFPLSPKNVMPFLVRASVLSVNPNPTSSFDPIEVQVISMVFPLLDKQPNTSPVPFTEVIAPWMSAVAASREIKSQETVLSAMIRGVIETSKSNAVDAVVSVIGVYLAHFVHAEDETNLSRSISFVVETIEQLPQRVQMEMMLSIIRMVQGVFTIANDGTDANIKWSTGATTSPLHMALIAKDGLSSVSSSKAKNSSLKGNQKLLLCCRTLLIAFGDALLLEDVQWCIGRGKGELTEISLRLWQEVLLLESVARGFHSDSGDSILSTISNFIVESKDQLQRLLPAHLFLASTSNLIREGETKEIKSKAFRLIADKSISLSFGSPELILFLDIVPYIVESVCDFPPPASWTKEDSVLVQSALIALEHITQSFQENARDDELKAISLEKLRSPLELAISAIKFGSKGANGNELLSGVLSCAALCTGTLVRYLGPQCLKELPELMESVFISLRLVDDFSGTRESKDVVRASLLRPLATVVETLPQFLASFLPKLLHNEGILNPSLRSEPSPIVNEATKVFDDSLADTVAPRLLIPAATRAVLDSLTSTSGIVAMLKILAASVNKATPACVSSNRLTIMDAILSAFEHNESPTILETAFLLLDETILKLSEVQLRALYSTLQKWRGSVDGKDHDATADKRLTFWTVTCRLCKRLKTLFLPCLSLNDITDELTIAVDNLYKPEKQSKRRKRTHGTGSFQVLFPLLSSLESALRADAHQGGTWIREDNDKYVNIMEPLTKLLQCRIGVDLQDDGTTAYDTLVHKGKNGNVVSTLVALASAVGDEHMWKPMNHAVLEACSVDRPEVRRSALLCMMEFMKVLGEEYMTLLPENLPVLSELLEDPNEEVSMLTKEVISLSEELTGENLEDNLR